MPQSCSSCQFFFASVEECHRYPPTVLIGSQTYPSWSMVREDDWCGEWKGQTTPGVITLTSLTPNSLPVGSTPATIDVVGTGFDNTCTVYADSTARVTFFVDIGHLQYTARPDLETAPGSHQITVANASSTSNALTFTFT